MSISSVLLAIAGLGLPGIRLGTEHTHPPGAPLARPWALLRKASYGALDAVVALTERTESWILQNTWARRTFVIANPLVLPLPTLGNVIKPDDVLPKHSRTLLCVGRMVPAKRFDRAVEAFSRLAGAHPDWVLAIIGDGPLRQDLTEQIGRLPCRDRVFVPGSVGNTADWYEQSDCLALTSDVEGFPNALLEAMAHGLCCVALDCDTGPRDLIDDGIDGLLVPAGDVDGLVFALDRCMSDSALRRRLGERAAAAAKRYEIDEVAAQWRRLGREFGVDWH